MRKLLGKDWFLYLTYLTAALIGIFFLTKFWIPEGYSVAGHDSGLAVNALEFLRSRLYAWDPQGFGRDNSGNFGSLTLHFVDYLSSRLSGVAYAGNQLNLFFWISMIFTASFILALQLKEKLGRFIVLLFPVFVTFNFYVLQSLFIVERVKYSILVASLLFLTVVIKFQEKKISLLSAGMLSSLIFLFFNSGSWLGIPLYGGPLVIGLSLFIFEMVRAVVQKNWRPFVRLISFFLITAIGFVVLNAYSILPYTPTLFKQDLSSVTSGNIISQNQNWLDAMSQASSYLNIFRLQGAPDWYVSPVDANLEHSYAELYMSNRLLVIFSFLFPVLISLSLLFIKNKEQKKLVSMFGLMMFLAVFFMAGSHSPLGFIYTFLYKHLPGFSIFRSPYYKFGGAFFISASILISFTILSFFDRLRERVPSKYGFPINLFLSFLIILLWFSFYDVIFSSEKLFTWQRGHTTRVKIPNYVNSFANWINSSEIGDSRILLVPPLNESWQNDAYSWGYWSLTNLPSLLSNKSFVANGGLESGQKAWIDKLYSLIRNKDEAGVFDLSRKLGIDYLLLRKDVLSDSSWSGASAPSGYEAAIDGFSSLTRVNTFGQWILYKFERDQSMKFSATNNLVSMRDSYAYLAQNLYPNENTVLTDNPALFSGFLSKDINQYMCQSCPLEEGNALTSLPQILILPNSPLYFFKLRREEKTLKDIQGDRAKIDAYLGFLLRRGAEIKSMWDMRLDARFSVGSLKVMNQYLEEVYKLFSPTAGSDQSFFEAKRLTDNMNIVERSFREIESNYDFGKKSLNFRQEVLDALWNINKLKGLFPIIDNKFKLETEKVYLLEAAKPNSTLYIDISTLPIDKDGKPTFPLKAVFNSGRKEIEVPLGQVKGDLVELGMPKDYSSGRLTLQFPSFPNLLKIDGTSLEQFPTGLKNCYEGSLSQFNAGARYLVRVDASKRDQTLKLFLKDGEIKNGVSNFLQGQDVVDVFPTLSYKPLYHIYRPSAGATSLKVFLCNSNEEVPIFEDFEFHEIASPNIISLSELPPANSSYPKISYERVNPTHYIVNIQGAGNPFILIFNEAYNSFWRIENANAMHFKVNDYANAWMITKTGDYILDLSYLPQSKFQKGLLITSFGLMGTLASLLWLVFRKKRND